MNCREVQSLLSEYADDMLGQELKHELEKHLSACPNCTREWNSLKNLLGELKTLPKVQAPQNFLKQVHERIDRRSQFEDLMRPLLDLKKIKVPLAATAAIFTIVLAISIQDRMPSEDQLFDRVKEQKASPVAADRAPLLQEALSAKSEQPLPQSAAALPFSEESQRMGARRQSLSSFQNEDRLRAAASAPAQMASAPPAEMFRADSLPSAPADTLILEIIPLSSEFETNLTELVETLQGQLQRVDGDQVVEVSREAYPTFLEKLAEIAELKSPIPNLYPTPAIFRIRLVIVSDTPS